MTTNNTQNAPLALPDGSQFVYFPPANGGFSVGTQGTDFFRGGDLVNGLTGVLHWSFAGSGSPDAWRIRPTAGDPGVVHGRQSAPGDPACGRRCDQSGEHEPAQLLHHDRHHVEREHRSLRTQRHAGLPRRRQCRGAEPAARADLDRGLLAQRRCLRLHGAREHHRERHHHRSSRRDQCAVWRRASVRVRRYRRHARYRRHPRAADLPHRHPVAGRRAARRSGSRPQPAAHRTDLRRRRCGEPGLWPAVHGHRQPLQVEGVPRHRRRRRRRRRPGLFQRHADRTGHSPAHLDLRHGAAGGRRSRCAAARRFQRLRQRGSGDDAERRRLHRSRVVAPRRRTPTPTCSTDSSVISTTPSRAPA